jgi:origin recognition complex subunit 3
MASQGLNLPAGLIVQGPENSTFTGLYDVLCKDIAKLEHTMCIKLSAGQSPNLKTILRYVNQAATLPVDEPDYGISEIGSKMTYDLQMLHLHSKRESLRQVVLLFEDSEAFEGALLSDLINLLK